MATIGEAATAFLAHQRIAVTGVSCQPQGHGANAVYRRLRDRGYQAFAVNPAEQTVEGDRCYHSVRDIPSGVHAVVIATEPDVAEATMRECAGLGIKYVWMHRALGVDSVSDQATVYGRAHGATVIDGGCPLMFGAPGRGYSRRPRGGLGPGGLRVRVLRPGPPDPRVPCADRPDARRVPAAARLPQSPAAAPAVRFFQYPPALLV